MANIAKVLRIDGAPPVFLRDGRLLTMCSHELANEAAYQVEEGSLFTEFSRSLLYKLEDFH